MTAVKVEKDPKFGEASACSISCLTTYKTCSATALIVLPKYSLLNALFNAYRAFKG